MVYETSIVHCSLHNNIDTMSCTACIVPFILYMSDVHKPATTFPSDTVPKNRKYIFMSALLHRPFSSLGD